MILYPAIDIQNGRVVRLIQGRFDETTDYGSDPVAVARDWQNQGAQWLHIVDLDGAKDGVLRNASIIKQISDSLDIPVQMGGGIRTEEDINDLLDSGIKRVILGTQVIEDIELLNRMMQEWPGHIAISLDCSNGLIQTRGWTKNSGVKATDLITKLNQDLLAAVVYTDIARDGMLTGPNFEALEEILNKTRTPIIASGGISSIEDLKRLKTLENKGLMGAITGKAIYEKKFSLHEALAIC